MFIAAMRLRQLGTTQSVTFAAPPEVHQSILDVCRKRPGEKLNSSDVITWVLEQTCITTKQLQPLFFAQGKDFCRRMQAADQYDKFLVDSHHRDEYLKVLRNPEQQTLEQLYAPQTLTDQPRAGPSRSSLRFSGRLGRFMRDLEQRQVDSDFDFGSINSSAMEEVEQQREVAYEIEEEREVQRPKKLKALRFPGELHDSILQFVLTGTLQVSNGCVRAHNVLDSTDLARKYGIEGSKLLTRLYVSAEFLRTVETKGNERNDNLMVSVANVFSNSAISLQFATA
jgi:hypothetical protein